MSDTSSSSSGSSSLSAKIKKWRATLPATLPAPPKQKARPHFIKPFFKSSHFKQRAKRKDEGLQQLDDNLLCSGIQSNPLFMYSRDISHELHHECDTCPSSLWFLYSPRTLAFKWTRKKGTFKAKLQEMGTSWNVAEYFMAHKLEVCHTKPQFLLFLGVLVNQFQENRMRALRQIGLHDFENLLANSQRVPDTSTKYLSWENNSCSYDAVLALVPQLLVQMEMLGFYPPTHGSSASSILSTPAVQILGCFHFCKNAPDTSTQVLFSNITRECAIDVIEVMSGKKIQQDTLWSAEDDQQFVDVGDVVSRVLFGLLQVNYTKLHPHTYELVIGEIPSRRDLKGAGIAQFLFEETDKKKVSFPSLGVVYFPKFKDKKTRAQASELVCKQWTFTSKSKLVGHLFGFIGSPLRQPEHFISGICGDYPDLYVNDAMLNSGTFQKVDARKILHGRPQLNLSLSVDRLAMVYMRW